MFLGLIQGSVVVIRNSDASILSAGVTGESTGIVPSHTLI